MEPLSPFDYLPGELLEAILRNLARSSLASFCLATATCRRFRLYRHSEPLRSIPDRRLSSIFEPECVIIDKNVWRLTIKDSEKCWALTSRPSPMHERRSAMYGGRSEASVTPPIRAGPGLKPPEICHHPLILVPDLRWSPAPHEDSFTLERWIGPTCWARGAVSLRDVKSRPERLKSEEIRFLLSEMIVSIKFLHEKMRKYLGKLNLGKFLIQPSGHLIFNAYSIATGQIDVWVADFRDAMHVAPEQVAAQPHVELAAVDFWLLGSVIYELLFGAPPFWDTNPMKMLFQLGTPTAPVVFPILGSIDDNLMDLLLRLLQKNAATRLKSFETLYAHPFFRGVDWARLERGESLPEPPTDFKSFIDSIYRTASASSGPERTMVAAESSLSQLTLPKWLEEAQCN